MKKIWQSSMKIKLLFSFLSIDILLIVIGIVTCVGMSEMKQDSALLYEDNLQNIDILHQIKETVGDSTFVTIDAINQSDASDEGTTSLQELSEQYETLIDTFLESKYAAAYGEDVADFSNLMTDYTEILENTVQTSSNSNGINEKINTLKDKKDEVESSINALISANRELASSTYQTNLSYANNVMKIVIVLIIFEFILSCVVSIYLYVHIMKHIKKGLLFANALKGGDLTVQLWTKSTDEFGQLIHALEGSRTKMEEVIRLVENNANHVSASSQNLSAVLEELLSGFSEISQNTEHIVGNIEEINMNAQDLKNSVHQLDNGINELAEQATGEHQKSQNIKERATAAKEKGYVSKKSTDDLYEEKEIHLRQAIEDGKVVHEISAIADLIADIASQTNLLSLNAAIEAARAGEQGQGFAVVAEQVKILAEQSSSYVKNIQSIVAKVQNTVNSLSENTDDVLAFVDTQVKSDYTLFISSSENYEKDAIYINDMAQNNAAMAQELNASTDEMNDSVDVIASHIKRTTERSEDILAHIEEAEVAIEEAAKNAQQQSDISEDLNKLVHNFKIS